MKCLLNPMPGENKWLRKTLGVVGWAGYFWWHYRVTERKGLDWGLKFSAQIMVKEPERFCVAVSATQLILEFSGLFLRFWGSGIQEWLIWIVLAQGFSYWLGLLSAESWRIHFEGTTSHGCKVGACMMSTFPFSSSRFYFMFFKTLFLDAYIFQIVMSFWLVDSFFIM